MKTVLILEDDVELGALWREEIEQLNIRVIHETSAEAAIQVLDRQHIDLVISDILIGNQKSGFARKGGFSLLSHMWLHMNPRPRVIAVSGASLGVGVDKHAELLNADRFLPKPVAPAELIECVKTLIDMPPKTAP